MEKKRSISDGVSSHERSWYKIIEEKVQQQSNITYDLEKKYEHNSPQSLEQLYYRTIFEKYYPNQEINIPYYWMPKYIEASDSSARSLDIYKETEPLLNSEGTEPLLNSEGQ